MASGDTLVTRFPYNNEPPSSNYATLDTRNSFPVLDFDASTDESAVFSCFMPRSYDGGGVTVTIIWTSTATSGDVIWDVAFERNEAGFDIDGDSFAAVNSVTDAAPANSGELQYCTITFMNGADMDSVVAGERFRLKLTRDANNLSDDMAADAEWLTIEIKET